MAISIPIISTFSPKGVRKAIDEFKKLETRSQKLGFALGKLAGPAAVGVAAVAAAAVGVGTALFGAAKAADADRKSQKELEATAQKFAKANKAQVAGLEETIKQMMLATGVADDDLRPAMSRLIRSFKNTDKSSRAFKIAMDISGRTGKDLTTVVEAISKAADGNTGALARLGIGLSRAELKTMTLDQVMALLEERFKGGAAEAANTLDGKIKRLSARFGEMVETLGEVVLPYLEDFADFLIPIIDAFGEKGLAGAVAEFKRQLAIGDFYQSPMGQYFRDAYEGIRKVYNAMVDVYNIGKTISGARFFSNISGVFGGPTLPSFSKMPSFDDFTNRNQNLPSSGGQARRFEMTGSSVTINVNGGDPQAVVDALRRYSRQNGGISGVRLS
jgi:hypothetical protein